MSHALLKELKKLGTAQNIKIYKRHGAQEPLFGVSFAHLNRLAKIHRHQTDVARKLWASRNTDARTLACMIAAPTEIKSSELDQWAKEVNSTTLAGSLGALTAASPFALSKIKKWSRSRREFLKDCGFSTLSSTLKNSPDTLSEAFCREVLRDIEKNIHAAPNFAKNAMNRALICIGVYKPKLTAATKKAARRIGTVDVDHGETSCKTPEAIPYIEKALAHQKKMAARRHKNRQKKGRSQ